MNASQDCHSHAGATHCADASSESMTCERLDRNYNVRIRIGSIFLVLFTSFIAVFGPILLRRFAKGISVTGLRFTMIKQFGTGVIIATALIHLLTHASLQFASDCLGELDYEATTTAIVMAGAFLAFSVEFGGGRYIMHRRSQAVAATATADGCSMSSSVGRLDAEKLRTQEDLEISRQPLPPVYHGEQGAHGRDISEDDDKLSVWVMEAGIIFHSIRMFHALSLLTLTIN